MFVFSLLFSMSSWNEGLFILAFCGDYIIADWTLWFLAAEGIVLRRVVISLVDQVHIGPDSDLESISFLYLWDWPGWLYRTRSLQRSCCWWLIDGTWRTESCWIKAVKRILSWCKGHWSVPGPVPGVECAGAPSLGFSDLSFGWHGRPPMRPGDFLLYSGAGPADGQTPIFLTVTYMELSSTKIGHLFPDARLGSTLQLVKRSPPTLCAIWLTHLRSSEGWQKAEKKGECCSPAHQGSWFVYLSGLIIPG